MATMVYWQKFRRVGFDTYYLLVMEVGSAKHERSPGPARLIYLWLPGGFHSVDSHDAAGEGAILVLHNLLDDRPR